MWLQQTLSTPMWPFAAENDFPSFEKTIFALNTFWVSKNLFWFPKGTFHAIFASNKPAQGPVGLHKELLDQKCPLAPKGFFSTS